MAQLNLDQLQLLLYFFAGGTVLILAMLITYIVVANRRQRTGSVSFPKEKASQTVDVPEADRVMSLLRAGRGGRLQVEVDGVRYQRLSDVEDPEIKRRIVATAMELIQFTGVLDAEPAEPAGVDKTQTWREDLREGSKVELERARSAALLSPEPSSSLAPHEVEATFLNMLNEMGHTPSAPDRTSLMNSLQQRLKPKPIEPQRARTFVDDIDDILQRRVQRTPALAGRDLHVQPGSGGTVRFSFEGKYYGSVEDVPNLTARQLIKDAIQEWDETT